MNHDRDEQTTTVIPSYRRKIEPAPERLVENGKIRFGCFNDAIRYVNLDEAKGPYKLPLPGRLQGLQLREWQAFQLGNQDYFMLVAIYNAKKFALVQFICYDIVSGKKFKYEKKVPAWKLEVPNGLFDSTAYYNSRDMSLKASHDIDSSKLRLEIAIKGLGDLPDVKATFRALHDTERYEPTVVSLPFANNRGMYSHKCLMPMKGKLRIGKDKVKFDPDSSFLIIDDHKGYYPFPTRYDWITGAGHTQEGSLIGFNLTDNQVLDQERYNENALWLDGRNHPLPPIKVSRPKGLMETWVIKDAYGMVDLRFHPVVDTQVDINALLFKSKYSGPYGNYEGSLTDSDGNKISIDQLFGMGEKFYLRI